MRLSVTTFELQPANPDGTQGFRALLCPLGTPTADGRMLNDAEGAISWRDLPLTMLVQLSLDDGHDGAEIAGRIDSIYRSGGELWGAGIFDSGQYGQEAARLVADQTLRGVSVDLAADEVELRTPDGDPIPPEAELDALLSGEVLVFVVSGKIMGATICAHPAFEEAHILVAAGLKFTVNVPLRFQQDGYMVALYPDQASTELLTGYGTDPAELHLTMALAPPGVNTTSLQVLVEAWALGNEAVLGTLSGLAVFSADAEGYPLVALVSADGLVGAVHEMREALEEAGMLQEGMWPVCPHVTLAYTPDVPTALPMALVGRPVTFDRVSIRQGQQEFATYPLVGMVAEQLTAAAAGLVPLTPPRDWFYVDEPAEPTPLTVTDDGQVYGHVAVWGTCHTGGLEAQLGYELAQQYSRCVEPPASQTGYAHFHLGEVVVDDGGRVVCGKVTLDGPHANLQAGLKAAQAHYDNTLTAAADVRVTDGEVGIWCCGALRPDVPAERVRALRSSALSGDWRGRGGELEMVGVLAVNVPGFPVLRLRPVDDSVQVTALQAAGAVCPCEGPNQAQAALLARMQVLGALARAPATEALRALAAAAR